MQSLSGLLLLVFHLLAFAQATSAFWRSVRWFPQSNAAKHRAALPDLYEASVAELQVCTNLAPTA